MILIVIIIITIKTMKKLLVRTITIKYFCFKQVNKYIFIKTKLIIKD